ncbi:D-alanyl-D-alanine carboxypeptidase family protein [Candidatus Kaiserbacteria bacterium]|nr:D-alanyl-D-alanine carboxypeptidase family protein [Candidatus Kaiserbacteria bacterium]
MNMQKEMDTAHYTLFGLIIVLLVAGGIAWHFLDQKLTRAESRISELEHVLATTTESLTSVTGEREQLQGELSIERARNEEFEDQIEDIADTVGVLDKLSKTDEELLQKYSKVYFLNEHYIPDSLSNIDKEWLYNEDLEKQIHKKVEPFLEDMLEEALDDGVKIWIVSAYRSWGEQANLKSAYTVTYGSGANTFSADQGYSEHQLGTAVDFTTEGLGGGLNGFGNTEAFEWLVDNAYKYGFVLSYDENNQYYIYEPWHWRFVGEDLARDLRRADAHFYDWEQRKIDEYLISIFD